MLLAMLAAFTPHLLDARLYGLPAMLNVNKHTDHKQVNNKRQLDPKMLWIARRLS